MTSKLPIALTFFALLSSSSMATLAVEDEMPQPPVTASIEQSGTENKHNSYGSPQFLKYVTKLHGKNGVPAEVWNLVNPE